MVVITTQKRSSTMSTIPTNLTEKQFDEHIRPYISTAKRDYECQIPLYKVFNYILYRLHTGCQWHQLPIVLRKCLKSHDLASCFSIRLIMAT